MDSSEELRRLRERYAAMSDDELEKIAGTAGDLTDDAHTVFIEEITRRGLPVPDDEALGYESPQYSERVTLRTFQDLAEALLAKGKLEAAGIACELPDVNMARMNWFWSNMLGGVRLQVDPDDFVSAAAVLDEPIPESIEIEGIGEVAQPRCPKCNSLDISHEAINKPIAVATMYINFPIPVPADRWKCNTCGQYWQDLPDNIPQT